MGITIIIKILIALSAYLIGSIPTAYVIFKLKKKDDIRKYGSGNVGGTNVIRTLGTSWGVVTIIADIVKGFIPILISFIVYPSDHILAAVVSVATVLGHIFPVYIRFRGGKAISTSFGVIIGITALPFISNPVWLRILPIFIILGVWPYCRDSDPYFILFYRIYNCNRSCIFLLGSADFYKPQEEHKKAYQWRRKKN